MLFEKKEIKRKISDLPSIQKCSRCCANGQDPLLVSGKGAKKILVVFNRPSTVQWESRDWLGDMSEPVFQALISDGVDPVEDTWVTGVLLCSGETRNPQKYEPCLAALRDTVRRLRPSLIISVGDIATGAILRLYNPRHFKHETRSLEFVGYCIPLNQEPGWDCWLAPVYSRKDIERHTNKDVVHVSRQWLFKHVLWAVGIGKTRPPRYSKPEIEILFQSDDIVSAIDGALRSELSSFDYETNTLEPWRSCADIMTCSLSYGTREKLERTVAFPMTSSKVREKWIEYLRSDVAKIGANIMFEHYWSTVLLDSPVINWVWDTNLGARILDCQGNADLKSTAFVNLGIIGYNDSVDPFMTNNPDGTNNLYKLKPQELLTYNAYDAAYTYECALRQRDLLGVSF